MKIVICLALLAALLLPVSGMAETREALSDGGFHFTLESVEASPGEAALHLLCRNDTGEALTVTLIDPTINGMPAGFRGGWGTDAFDLPATGETAVDILMETDDPDELPEALSLRFAANGAVSSPLSVTPGDPAAIEAASFEAGAREPQLVEPKVGYAAEDGACRVVFRDSLPVGDLERLDYGQLLVCQRTEDADGELLTQLCAVEAEIAPDGSVTADYSGLALVLAADHGFIVQTAEVERGSKLSAALGDVVLFSPGFGDLLDSVKPVSLTGEAIYYATLKFELSGLDAGAPVIENVEVTSAEAGGSYTSMPCALFDVAQVNRAMWRVRSEGGETLLDPAGSNVASCRLDEPMRFELVPAESLGEIVVCFEYYFTDGTDVVHAVLALDAGERNAQN